jgi:SAM-dependent methyltransferase
MFLSCFQDALEQVVLRGNERVLDVACGPAAASSLLARKGHPVDAVDECTPLVRVLRQRFQEQGLTGIGLREMKPERLEFDDESFELGLSMFGLARSKNLEQSLWELSRVLKGGGHLLACFWARPEESPLFEATQSALGAMFPGRRHAPPPRLLLADPRRLETALLSAGFGHVTLQRSSLRLDVADLEEFWARLSEADVRVWLVRLEVGEAVWKAALPRAHNDLRARIGVLPSAIDAEAWVVAARKS